MFGPAGYLTLKILNSSGNTEYQKKLETTCLDYVAVCKDGTLFYSYTDNQGYNYSSGYKLNTRGGHTDLGSYEAKSSVLDERTIIYYPTDRHRYTTTNLEVRNIHNNNLIASLDLGHKPSPYGNFKFAHLIQPGVVLVFFEQFAQSFAIREKQLVEMGSRYSFLSPPVESIAHEGAIYTICKDTAADITHCFYQAPTGLFTGVCIDETNDAFKKVLLKKLIELNNSHNLVPDLCNIVVEYARPYNAVAACSSGKPACLAHH